MPDENRVSRAFQFLLAIYILATGEIATAIQGAFFGIDGGGETEFAAAMVSSLLVDLMLLAPVLVLSSNPSGILHPLLLAVIVWPLLLRIPSLTEEFGSWAALFLGERVETPFFIGLGWRPGPEAWLAVAKFNVLQVVALGATYLGFAFAKARAAANNQRSSARLQFNASRTRSVALLLIAVSTLGLFALLAVGGGLAEHIAAMSQGRFRSLAGLGPLVALADLGVIAVLLWLAIRPQDGKSPLFLGSLFFVAAAQFVSNGSRGEALSVFLLAALVWALRTRRVPWRLALVIAPAGFFLLGVLSVVRTSGLVNQSATEAVSGRSVSDILVGVQEEIRLRRALSAQVPVVEDGFEITSGPLWGESYLAAILAFIPRSVWEDKPRGPGSLYGQLFLGELREGTAFPLGPTAEAYWNFGAPGVVLVFLLYGALLKLVNRFYETRADNPFVLTFYVLFITSFRISTDDLVRFQHQILMLLVAVLIIRALAVKRELKRMQPAHGSFMYAHPHQLPASRRPST